MFNVRASVVGGLAFIALAVPATAVAAPATVNLRIEGPTSTLFEGSVTTDVREFRFNSGANQTPTTCDGTSATGGPSPVPVPTSGAALTATTDLGVTLAGQLFSFGPAIETINGVDVSFNGATNDYLAEYFNFAPAALGACSTEIRNGDQVLFAYANFGAPALRLSGGPALVAPGQTARLTVVDGATGAPVAGASVGGATTGADGTATVGPFATRGPQAFKASKPGTIRSNILGVCVSDGADGFCNSAVPGQPAPPPAPAAGCVTTGDDGRCGTPDERPALGAITSVKEKQRFPRGEGPRTLAGTVDEKGSGVSKVRLRLTRSDQQFRGRDRRRKYCFTFDDRAERLELMSRCGAARGSWFEVGDEAQWSYLLPSRLPRGRYVLDVETTDRAGNVDRTLQRTRNRVVFNVG